MFDRLALLIAKLVVRPASHGWREKPGPLPRVPEGPPTGTPPKP
jgi:hypothetical protein